MARRIHIIADDFAKFDNIVVTGNPVPVPGAVWLFGSGLALLGWRRRRTG
jgi:hypothetical protein